MITVLQAITVDNCLQRCRVHCYQDNSESWHAAGDLELSEELVSADDLAQFFGT